MAGIIIGVPFATHFAIRAAFGQIVVGATTLQPIGRILGCGCSGCASWATRWAVCSWP